MRGWALALVTLVVTMLMPTGHAAVGPGAGGGGGSVTGSYSFAYPLVLSGTSVTATATITNNDSRALQTLGSGFTNRNTNARLVAESSGGGSANVQIADPDFFGLFSTAQLGLYWTNTAGQLFFYGSSDAGNTVANVATFSPTNIFFNTNAYAGTLNSDDRLTTVRKASELTAHPSSDGYEFWDDFNRTITNSPGVSPSGHTWGFSSASGVNSNVVFVQDGAFKIATNAQAGATYWGITNSNPSTTWNKFKGSFLYREYDANGFRQNLGFILANNYFRGGTNWLHVGINQNGFYVQRELAGFFINELFATELETDIEHTYEILLSDDKLWARVAGNYYFVQDDAITNYTSFPVVIYEHNMKMTNRPAQYFGEWLSAAAGQFESPFVNMAKPFSYNSNSTAISSISFSDGSEQTTAWTGLGGSGGTNFPNVNLLLGNTNLVLSAGVRKAFHNQTNGSHGINLNLAVPESGYVVTYSVSNSAASDITVTFYTNSVAANPYDRASRTNVNTFTASASAMTEAELKYYGSGLWVLESVKGVTAIQKFGPGIITDTNGVNGLDITVSTKRLTNYAHAATITINGATDVDATITNDVTSGVTLTLANATVGTSGVFRFKADGSGETVAFQCWPAVLIPLATNNLVNTTNISGAASKWMHGNYDIARGANGVTNCFLWVIKEP